MIIEAPMTLNLKLLPDHLAVCRLPAKRAVPAWALSGTLHAIVWTTEETSIVCQAADVPEDVRAERGWRALAIDGPLDFALTGILVKIAQPLSDAGIPIFALSTFDTDYVLVKDSNLKRAINALAEAGHPVQSIP
ncbi:ACT domain-containing protein [Desulfosarcina ovata]|nr:ACT domain-containing protein [Desulfosarcina ovata]